MLTSSERTMTPSKAQPHLQPEAAPLVELCYTACCLLQLLLLTQHCLAINNIPPVDGMAFFLLDPKHSDVPDEHKGSGLGLPLYAHSTSFIAVEFDTYLNSQIDYGENHIGIDINSVVSAKYVNLSFGLTTSSFVYSWVDYSTF
ncbi:hypothetical protein L7F22_034439 [Adiantum nelumboides]|nr:hypothetical protein [Adiantum nelumboides]